MATDTTNLRIISAVADRIAERYVDAMRRGALDTVLGVVTGLGLAPGMPVDTGAARGSVALSINEPSNRPFNPRKTASRVTRSEAKIILRGLQLGDKAVMTITAPYFPTLNKGRYVDKKGITRGSLQAPRGITKLAIKVGLASAVAAFEAGVGMDAG